MTILTENIIICLFGSTFHITVNSYDHVETVGKDFSQQFETSCFQHYFSAKMKGLNMGTNFKFASPLLINKSIRYFLRMDIEDLK